VKPLLGVTILLAVVALAVWLFLDRGEAARVQVPADAPSSATQVPLHEPPAPETRQTRRASEALEAPASRSQAEDRAGGASAPESSGASTLGVIGGKVTFVNKPRVLPKRIGFGAMQEPCGGSAGVQEHYVVGANGGAANVLVFVKSGPATQVASPVPEQEIVVDVLNCRFTPHVLGMRAKQPLRMRNSGHATHNFHLMSRMNGDWNETLATGASFLAGEAKSAPVSFPEVPVRLGCDIHPWMQGYLGVFAHDSFAVTGMDGMYELKRLPPGEYVIETWHEQARSDPASFRLKPGEMKTLDFEMRFQ
jgi:hypothetical protein